MIGGLKIPWPTLTSRRTANWRSGNSWGVLTEAASLNYQSRSVANELAQGVAEGSLATTASMLAAAGKTAAAFLKVMLEPMYTAGAKIVPESEAGQKKQRKKRSLGQQITR